MKLKKIMSFVLSVLVGTSFTFPTLTATAIAEEKETSEIVLSETPDEAYTTDVQTTTSDFVTTNITTIPYNETNVTTTTPEGGMMMPTTTTTAVVEELDYPFVKPFELKVYIENWDINKLMNNVGMELKITRITYDDDYNMLDYTVTTEKLNTGENGYAVYKADCEILNKYDVYNFSVTPELPEGFRIAREISFEGFEGIEVEKNSNMLSETIKFKLVEDLKNPLGTGAYTTTTTTTDSDTTTTTTTTTTTDSDAATTTTTTTTDSDATTTTTDTTPVETTTTYIRSTPISYIGGFDDTVDIEAGESITMDIRTDHVSTITFNSDNEYITVDGTKEYGLNLGEGEFTISCADNAVAGQATVTITYHHSITNEVAEKTISVNIVASDAELPQTGYPDYYKLFFIAIIMTLSGAVIVLKTRKEKV